MKNDFPPLPALDLYIDGTWAPGSSGRVLDVLNPATEELLGQLPLASKDDLDRALASAAAAFPAWRDAAPARRTSILVRAAALVRANSQELARLTTLELGMRFADALVLVERAADVLEWDANEGRRLYGRVVPSEAGLRQMVVREAIGPVASFSPWNGSVFTPCRKIGSALAAGCTLILKAAEETPFSTIALVRLFEQAGVPPGVLHLVYGEPAMVSRHLIASPIVRMISFTGSVPVGRHLATMAAGLLKPSVMELGGHAPVIVCADADIDTAVERLAGSKYFNAGQVCFSPSRVYVERPVYESFVAKLTARAGRINVGNGMDASVAMGPLANLKRLQGVDALVQDAVGRGARLRCGGRRVDAPGFFYEPTVLSDVPGDAAVLHDEPFGPLLTVAPFDDLVEALRQANALSFGLASYAFTSSAATADLIARALDAGMVAINHFGVSTHGMPFGGVKESGSGREGGKEGIASYTVAKTVSHLFS